MGRPEVDVVFAPAIFMALGAALLFTWMAATSTVFEYDGPADWWWAAFAVLVVVSVALCWSWVLRS